MAALFKLSLAVLIVAPFAVVFLLSDLTPVPCHLSNLTKPDVAGLAARRILRNELGVVDFRNLSDTFDRVCLVDVDEPGQLYMPGILDPAGLIGKRYCNGWDRDSALFALVDSKTNPYSYALLQLRFGKLSATRLSHSPTLCAPTGSAVVHCIDQGGNGILCNFKPQ
jgi:hypothetical protein